MFSSLTRSSFAALGLLAAGLLVADATQVMHRPDNYKDAPNVFQTAKIVNTTTIHKRAQEKVSFAYFTNWGIYGANFRECILLPI